MKTTLKTLLLILALHSTSHAYHAMHETAEILPDNYFNLGVAPQLFVSDGGGIDISVFADMHAWDSTDLRFSLGTGEIDFWAQASMKWVPFPDVGDQPALGMRGAIGYSRQDRHDLTYFQIAPIISKKSNTSSSEDMIPYAAIPFTFFNGDDSYIATQLTIGAQWFPWKDYNFGAEFNLDLKNAPSSLSVYFNFPFEGSTGYKRYE